MTDEVAPKVKVKADEGYEVIKAQEDMVVQVQTGILRAMRERGVKQAELAERLGVSQARVSQMFGDEARNLTLRTIAKIYHVLGTACVLAEKAMDMQEDAPPGIPAGLARPEGARVHGRFRRPPSSVSVAASRRFSLRSGPRAPQAAQAHN